VPVALTVFTFVFFPFGSDLMKTPYRDSTTHVIFDLLDDSYIEKRAAVACFCSCKTDIHAVHGNNVGTAPQVLVLPLNDSGKISPYPA
jgi:hypothetical protein